MDELEKKILSLPPSFKMLNGAEGWAGLCLKYKHHLKKWSCNYGSHQRNKGLITGDTPSEAVDNFINFIREYHKNEKRMDKIT